MQHILIDYMTNKIQQIASTRGNSILLFSDDRSLKGSDIYYFWEYVEKYNNEYFATSVNDAIANGVDTFVAKRRCRKGHFPIRNLNNQCNECATAKPKPLDSRATPTSIMMRNAPDMVIDRDSAILVGFTVYRTGDVCCHGHTGYRYVKNKTCVECHRVTKYHRG